MKYIALTPKKTRNRNTLAAEIVVGIDPIRTRRLGFVLRRREKGQNFLAPVDNEQPEFQIL